MIATDRLCVAANEAMRAVLRVGLTMAGHVFERRTRARIASFATDQRRLARAYRIGPATPIRPWGPEVERAVAAFAAAHPEARFASTSGSTARPKRIAFTPARLRAIDLASLSVATRTLLVHRVRRASVFILAGLKDDDDSLTALLLRGGSWPPWPVGLVTPGKHLTLPALAPAIDEHGATAARLWLLALCDPGMLYGTNPSTLAVFLTAVHDRWREATAMARAFARAPDRWGPDVRRIARRVAAPGHEARLRALAEADRPLPVARWLPGLRCWCCWDGGYVRPFLEQVARFLPPPRFRHVPMYSMSTETVETLNWYDRAGRARFLPLAPGVLYEMLPEAAPDEPARLLPATALRAGERYTMVVSDPWGLRRYQTDDLFECRGHVGGGVPDLVFVRRRGLSYSFTGEKLTGEQCSLAFERLRDAHPALRAAGIQMTAIPALPAGESVPRYRLVLAWPGAEAPDAAGLDADAVARAFDRILGEINGELAAKQRSGRLGPTQARPMGYDALAAALDPKTRAAGGDRSRRAWESQFKLLPLYRRTWEEHGFEPDRGG